MARVLHVLMTSPEGDGRLARAIDATHKAGADAEILAPSRGLPEHAMTLRTKLHMALAYGIGGRAGNWPTDMGYWSFPVHRMALAQAIGRAPDLLYAHDWDALPVVAKAARHLGVPYIFDAHEHAVDMFDDRPAWRLVMPRAIARLEYASARDAAAVITVSDEIARALQARLRLPRTPLVVRNIPDSQPAASHPVSPDRVVLHYHGILSAGRGLEAMLNAVPMLPERFRLRITGPWRQEGSRRNVERLLTTPAISRRAVLHPPMPNESLVEHASEADIGLILLADHTVHNRGALPNKFFEYLQAGLMVVASGSQAMGHIINAYDCGILLDKPAPEALVEAVSGLSLAKIENYRSRARHAGAELSWNSERQKLEKLIGDILVRP